MYQLEEISIEVTNSCPLACMHCSSGSAPIKMEGELTLVEHINLLDQARELGATVFSISGGSPLNYALEDAPVTGLDELVEHAVRIGFERILIYTTGHSEYGPFIWNYPWLDKLMGYEQMVWIFSLHSHDKAVNDYIMRRDGAWEEIRSSIISLQRVLHNETVEVHMVPMHPNFRHIPNMRRLCSDLGVSKMSCLRFVPQTRGKDNDAQLGMSKAEFAEMQFILHKEVELNETSLCEIRLGCPIDFRHAVGLLDEKRKPCHAGDDLILIRPTGDVHPCAAWKSLPADANVRNASLKEIWEESAVFNTIRTFKYGVDVDTLDYTSGYKLLGGTCGHCSMLNSCMTGCPAQRLHALGADSIEALYTPSSDPLCPRGD